MNRGTTNIPVVCLVIKNNEGKVLFIKRQNTGWQDGYYALPGGHLEEGESFKQAAVREAHEEVGLLLKPNQLEHLETRHMFYPAGIRIGASFAVKSWQGKPINAEPEKSSEVAWLDPQHLPPNTIDYDAFRVTHHQPYVETGWPE